MRYRTLGHTGLFVSELCLGTMTFGQSEGIWSNIAGLPQADAERLLGMSLDAGINFLDTADVYSAGQSEHITGQALRNLQVPREDVVVATKVFGETGPGKNSRGTSRHHILNGVKASLARLQFDYIDLYQIHGFDPVTPMEETLRALDQLVRHGWVRYIGVSNWAAWQIATALGISDRLGLARFDSLQAYYSVVGRDLERELIPMLRNTGLGLLVWSPLAGGYLSGKYDTPGGGEEGARRKRFDFPPIERPRGEACVRVLRDIAQAHSTSPSRVALAWLLQQPQVTSVILGAKTSEQLSDNLGATQLTLSADELEQIGKVSTLPAEYPGWMFAMQGRYRGEQLDQAKR